uniref:Mre11_DNA_bind domain-containing protein n=1 Tax=Trichuris muris TaxID=70415 RepID=A0A5S6QRY4_TRIMR
MLENIRLLVATDVHLGFAETSPIRKNDSVNTFEEILQIAVDKEVDALLLGGDLFHDNRPSRAIYNKCVELLRKYCFSDREVKISFSNDVSVNFNHSEFKHANFQDHLLHVGLPVFSIHGNHDDVASSGLCALDMLHGAGLLNYFGKHQSVEEITVSPICICKGRTRIALYGIGFIRDERLHRMFLNKKVHFVPPEDSCFCILVLHQNRVGHTLTNYIPKDFLPKFINLVIWGHEHPCLIDPELYDDMYIMQPGSTIATSLAEGEAGRKYVSIVEVSDKTMRANKIELKTARLFYFTDLNAEQMVPNRGAEVEVKLLQACVDYVESLISTAREDRLPSESLRPELPLIRLRIHCSADYPTFNVKRFGHYFEDKIANPENVILFVKSRAQRSDVRLDRLAMESAAVRRALELQVHIEDVIKDYFKKADPLHQMSLLSESSLREALRNYVYKYEANSLAESVHQQFAKAVQLLTKRGVRNAEEIRELLGKVRRSRVMPCQPNRYQSDGKRSQLCREKLASDCIGQSSLQDIQVDVNPSARIGSEQVRTQQECASVLPGLQQAVSQTTDSEEIMDISNDELDLIPASFDAQEFERFATEPGSQNNADLLVNFDDELSLDAAPLPTADPPDDCAMQEDDFDLDIAEPVITRRATTTRGSRRGGSRGRQLRGQKNQQSVQRSEVAATSVRGGRGANSSRARQQKKNNSSSVGMKLNTFFSGTVQLEDDF